jgi:hypothetical protein
MRSYVLISLFFVCLSATAGIYKWVDEDGKVHYSDSQVDGSKQVELPKAVTYSPTVTSSSKTSGSKEEKDAGYTRASIVKPTMNETIRSNNGDVTVSLEITPGLREGHSVTAYLDGNEFLTGEKTTSFVLENVDRGSHTLRVSVFNQSGVSLISSSSVIFHLIRETTESDSNAPEDNSDAYTPDFKKDESEEADFSKDYSKDYSNDFSKDYDSSNSYKEGAENFKQGVPSKSGTFSSGTNYKPNYNQK